MPKMLNLEFKNRRDNGPCVVRSVADKQSNGENGKVLVLQVEI